MSESEFIEQGIGFSTPDHSSDGFVVEYDAMMDVSGSGVEECIDVVSISLKFDSSMWENNRGRLDRSPPGSSPLIWRFDLFTGFELRNTDFDVSQASNALLHRPKDMQVGEHIPEDDGSPSKNICPFGWGEIGRGIRRSLGPELDGGNVCLRKVNNFSRFAHVLG